MRFGPHNVGRWPSTTAPIAPAETPVMGRIILLAAGKTASGIVCVELSTLDGDKFSFVVSASS